MPRSTKRPLHRRRRHWSFEALEARRLLATIPEVEPNDSLLTATPYVLNAASGDNLTGTIARTGDADYFQVTLAKGQLLTANFSSANFSEAVTAGIEVLNTAGQVVAHRYQAKEAQYLAPAAGTYYVRLTSTADTGTFTGNYEISASYGTQSFTPEVEPNNNVATATSITNGAYFGGTISGDSDFYAISGSLTAGQSVAISFVGVSSTNAPTVKLLNGANTVIASDNLGRGLIATIPADGSYKLEISPTRGDGSFTGEYLASANVMAVASSAATGSDFTSSQSLGTSANLTAVSGRLTTLLETHVYTIQTTDLEQVNAAIAFNAHNRVLRLYDEQGHLLMYNVNGTVSTGTPDLSRSPGKFYLTVQAMHEAALGPYQLVFTRSSFSKQRDVPLFFLDFTSQIGHLGYGSANFSAPTATGFVQGIFESRYDGFDVDVTQTLPTNTSEFVGQGYGSYSNLGPGAGGWGSGGSGTRRPDGDSVVDARNTSLASLNYGVTAAMNHELGHGVGLGHLRSPRGLMSYDTQQPVYPYGSGYSFIAGDSYVSTNYLENSRDYLDFVLQAGRQVVETEPNDSVAAALGLDRYLVEMQADFNTGATIASQGSGAAHVTSLDYNSDGNLDVAVAHDGSNSITLFLGNGAGGFTFSSSVTLPNSGDILSFGRLLSGDLNADGIGDLAIAAQGGATSTSYLFTFLGNVGATLTPVVSALPSAAQTYGAAVLAKFNSDNFLDVAVGYNNGTIVVGINNGAGTFTYTTISGSGLVLSMDAGDVNGDGKIDLVSARYGTSQIGVQMGNGNGTFAASVPYATSDQPGTIALWDYDGNGKLDVAVGTLVSHRLEFFTNSGTGTYTAAPTLAYVHDADFANLAVGDINNDGRADLVGGNYSNLVAFLALPGGVRSDVVRLPATNQTTDVAILDANEDGRLDLVGGVYFQSQIEPIFGRANDVRNDRAVVIGNVTTSTDADYYSFTATAGQTFAIDVDSAEFQNSLDAVMSILDGAGNVLATSNDALDRDSGVDSVDPYLTFTFAAAGDYKVRISGVRETVGDYRLKITPQAAFDTAGPRIIGASPTGVSNVGSRQIVLLVNDQLDPARLAANIQVLGATTGLRAGSAVFDPIDSALVWTAEESLPIDTYTVTLVSGASGITDLRGNALDGETTGSFAFPQVSGNGTAGGNFSYQFGVNLLDGTAAAILSSTYRRHEYNRGLFTFASSDPLSLTSVAATKFQARGAGADALFGTGDDRLLPLDALQDKLSPTTLYLYTRGIPDPDRYRVEGTFQDAVGRTVDLSSISILAGVDVPESSLFTDATLTASGLTGRYVNSSLHGVSIDDWFNVQPIVGTRVDPNVHFAVDEFGSRAQVSLTGGTNADWDNFSAQWDGYLQVTTAGTQVYTRSNDGSRLWIDTNNDGSFSAGELLSNGWGTLPNGTITGPLSAPLSPGAYKIRIQYATTTGTNEMLLEWLTPDRPGQLESVGHGPSIIDTSIQAHSNVAANVTNDIAVTFSGAVNVATLNSSNFKVRYSPDPTFYDGNDTFLADADNAIAWDAATHKATFTTATKLAAGYYQVEINGDAGGVASPTGALLDGEFLDSYVAGSTNWTWQDAPSGDGLAGGDYLATFSVSTAPQITAVTTDTGSSSTDRITSDTTLVLQGRAVASATIAVQLAGTTIGTTTSNASGDWTFDYTGTALTAGLKSFTATSTVASVTSSPSEAFDVTIDNAIAAPTLTSITTDTGVSSSDRITQDGTLVFTGTAEPGSTITLSRTGVGTIGTFAAGALTGKWTFDYSATTLVAGTYSFTIAAEDVAGNIASTPFSVTVDNTAPTPVIVSIQDDTGSNGTDRITRDAQLIFTGTAEANSTVTLRIGSTSGAIIGTGVANGSGNWSVDYTSTTLADGTYSFFASIVDAAGNVSSSTAAFTVTVDTAAPPITPVALDLIAASDTFQVGAGGSSTDNVTFDNTPSFTGTAVASLLIEIFVDGSPIGTTTAAGDGSWSFTAPTIADGAHNFTWRALDLAGNATTQSPALAVTIDTGAPTLAAITDKSTNEDQTVSIPLALGDSLQTPQNVFVVTQFGTPALINTGAITLDTSGGFNQVLQVPPTANAFGTTTVSITAYDLAGNAGPLRTFNLAIQSVNDPPTAVGLSASIVAENAAGANVGIVSVSDVDVGDTHTWLVNDGRFEIIGTQLKLKTGQALDFEAGNPVIQITATDFGGLFKAQSFTITVTNVNEAPTSVSLSNQSVAENAAGAAVGTITAVDPDVGDTLTLTVNDSRFEVIGTQLKLKTGQALDAEATPTINLTVTATDVGLLTKAQPFTITVTNVNEAPTDISLSALSFAENLTGVTIANVTVTDSDGVAPYTYAINDSRLEIVSGALRIKAGQSFDFETTPSVPINVTATDAGGLGFTKPFTLTVTNVNEAPTSISLSASTVVENAPASTLIGNLSGVDPDVGNTLTFSVTDPRFTVTAGQLFTTQSLDFEATPSISVDVTATDAGGLAKTQPFTITVTNANEAPTAIGLSANSVAENAAGAIIGNVTVTDPDVGDTQTIIVNDSRFEVVAGKLQLKTGQSLDREAAATIGITITTTDGGGLTKNQQFTINVTNVDEAPTAISLSANSVNENASNVTIGALTVTDPEGGTFTFGLSDNRFSVVGGNLRLDTPLNFEAEPAVALTVTATDSTGLSKPQLFTINVANVNEAPQLVQLTGTTIAENVIAGVIGTVSFFDPDSGDTAAWTVSDTRFEVVGNQLKLKANQSLDREAPAPQVQLTVQDAAGLQGVSPIYTLTVTNVNEAPTSIGLSANQAPENNNGFVIGTLSAIDPDVGDTVTFSSGDPRFTIAGGNQLVVASNANLDYEVTPSINVTLTATDVDGLTKNQTFAIAITDRNDAPSAINLSNASVLENAAGATIGNVLVTDQDALATFTYTVDDNRFEIVGGALRLKTGVALNFEAEPSVALNVGATDNGGLSIAKPFTITVTNVNEAPLSVALSAATVAENAIAQAIGNVTGVDPDSGDPLTFTVDDPRFEIVSGQLKLKALQSLNFEAGSPVPIIITAHDAIGLTKAQPFTITVTDVNERPTNVTLSNLSVSENAIAGAVGTVGVVDEDASETQTLSVSDARFEIVGTQLKLKANQSLDYESTPSVALSITTVDHGGLALTKDFTILVNNVNEAPYAIFPSGDTIQENRPGGVVTHVAITVLDPDIGDTHTFTLSDNRFEIVDRDLKLKDGVALDFESTQIVVLNVTAKDSGGLSIDLPFTVTVVNVNEAPSGVLLGQNHVAENAPGAVVGPVSALDPDFNDTFTFTVNDPRFEVVAGQLKLVSGTSLNYETATSVSLDVTARDFGGLANTQSFVVSVDNVNEAPINVSVSPLTVAENAAGAIIGAVTVADPDNGDTFTYTVSDARFVVTAGQLRLATGQALDFEGGAAVPITLQAIDAGGLTVSKPFTVTVTNVNEAPTAINLAPVTVAENAAGAAVGNLSVVDADSSAPFTLTVADARFEIIGTQLKLKTGQALDFEQGAAVSLNVTARDSGNLTFTQAVNVTVQNAPEAPTAISLSRDHVFNNIAGAWVADVKVTDPDASNNHTFQVSDNRFEVRSGRLYLRAGQSLTETAGTVIPVRVDVQDAAAGSTINKTFNLAVDDGPTDWLFATQWRPNRFDINVDGHVTPLDALLVIIQLNAVGPTSVAPAVGGTLPPLFLDPSGDNQITPLDALQVIIFLNAGGASEGEAPSEATSAVDAVFADEPADEGFDPRMLAWWAMSHDEADDTRE
jgi:hypothetical protein